MKTKTLSFSMMAALTHMFDNEERATNHSPDACRNVEIGFFIKSNTATALEKRGLALRVCCPFDCEEIELQLTESGRHWVKQNTRTTANGCACVTCTPGGELDPLKVAGRCGRQLPKAPSPAPEAPQESEAPQATRKKTYRIETYNMHRNPPTESLTVQGYAPALIIAKTLQATRQFSVLLRHVDANGRVGSAIRFRS